MMEEVDRKLVLNSRFNHHIDKYVNIKTVDSEEKQGWLKCIDPLSGNVILLTADENYSKVTGLSLIMGDAVSDIEALGEPDDKINELFETMLIEGEAARELSDRKVHLLAWLKKNRLPVVEKADHSLVVAGIVTISPPYKIDNCTSPNRITLKSIRRLIKHLPPISELAQVYKKS